MRSLAILAAFLAALAFSFASLSLSKAATPFSRVAETPFPEVEAEAGSTQAAQVESVTGRRKGTCQGDVGLDWKPLLTRLGGLP